METPGQFTTKVLTPVSATITSSGSGITNNTYHCVLAPTSAGALGGINEVFKIVVTTGSFPATATPSTPGYYTSLAGYTYDTSNGGPFDAVPCTPTTNIPGWGTGSISLNVYMGLYTVQDTLGRDATSGVYLGKIDNGMGKWCGGGAIASATYAGGAPDVGMNAGFSCSSQLPLVWVGYDNHGAMQSIFSYLNGLIPSQRPCVWINGIFLATGSTGSAGINGKTCWKGETPYLTGFFVMPGIAGDIFPVIDSNGGQNPNGGNVTDANPDQSGSTFRDFTCWGDPTSIAKPQGCIRFYGLVQRAILENLTADALPGCLVCVGAYSNGSGSIAESFFIDFRAAFSGDDSTLTPVVALDSVGATTTGANNNVMLRLRTYKDFYESLAVRPCDGTAGSNAAHLNTFVGIKIEMSGMDNYISPANEIGLNDQSCLGLSFPSTTGTSVPGLAASGVSGENFYGLQMINPAVGTYGMLLQGTTANNNCCIQVFGDANDASAQGAGVRIEACSNGCQFNLTSNGTADYALTVHSTSGSVSSGAVEYELAYGAALPSWNIDSGLNVGCGSGLGVISITYGNCQASPSGAFHPGYVSGRYYTSPMTQTLTLAMAANKLYAEPFYVGVETTFSKISIDVTTPALGRCELGIYNNNSGAPGSLLVDAGNVSDGSAGAQEITGQSLTLSPGWYWLAVGCSDMPSLEATSSTNGIFGFLEGLTAQNSTAYQMSVPWTYFPNNLPLSFGTPTYVGNAPSPSIYVRL